MISYHAHDEFIQPPHYPSQQLPTTLQCSGLGDNKGLIDKATFNVLCSYHCVEWVENRIKVYRINRVSKFIASEVAAGWQRTLLSPDLASFALLLKASEEKF